MERFRNLAPIVIAAVVAVVGLNQLHPLNTYLNRGGDSQPCKSLYEPLGPEAGTPGPEVASDGASIATILAVVAANNRVPELHAVIKAQDSRDAEKLRPEILDVLRTYSYDDSLPGAPN
jgi:hypothetical protein